MKKYWRFLIIISLSWTAIPGASLSPLSAQESETSVSSRMATALDHYKTGAYEQAIAQWNALLNEPQLQRDRLRLGQVWNYLSLSQQKLEQWENATHSIQQSLKYLAPNPANKFHAPHQQSYAQALSTQGQLHLELGNDTEALSHWQNSEQLYRRLGDELGVGGSLMNQALALEQSGLYRRACLTILEAVQIENRCNFTQLSQQSRRSIFAAFSRLNSPSLQATSLQTFSKILLQLGELDLANTALQMAQPYAKHSPVIQSRLQFTQAALSVAQYQALKHENSRTRSQKQSRPLQARLMTQATQAEQNYQQLLGTLNNIGSEQTRIYYQAQVDYLAFLVDYSTWLKAQQRESQGKDKKIQQQIAALQTRSLSQASLHPVNFTHIKQAELLITLLKQDVNQYQGLAPYIIQLVQHVIQFTSASPFVDPAEEAQMNAFAYGTLGYFYEVQKQWAQAERATQLALGKAQSIQNAQTSYRWQWQLGRILTAQGQRNRAIEAYEQALIALQSIRQDLLSLNRNAQLSFRDEIEPSYRQLVALLLSEPNPNNQNLSTARQVIDRLQVSEVEDFLLQNCINASLASLDTYIERKAPTTALIYTIIQDEHLDIIVKIPNTNQIQFHRVHQSKTHLQDVLKTYRRSLQQKLPSAKSKSQAEGQQLYQWLIQPFQAEFQRQNIDTLVFVLDGSLRDIPMATLYDGQRYLIEQYAVAVTPGLQVLDTAQSPVATQQRAVVAGASQGDLSLGLPALPAVRTEILEIESVLPQTNILLDSDFTEAALSSLIQGQSAPIIHIATHGQFSSDPNETFIMTGQGERLDLTDLGNLLRQRNQFQSQTLELLFLSACQTLAGDRWAALGMAGVAIRSGAQSTIASIWNADDEASAELVSRFYFHLTAKPGRTKAEALRLAQIEMLKTPRYDRPVYWSPYVLIGNWQ